MSEVAGHGLMGRGESPMLDVIIHSKYKIIRSGRCPLSFRNIFSIQWSNFADKYTLKFEVSCITSTLVPWSYSVSFRDIVQLIMAGLTYGFFFFSTFQLSPSDKYRYFASIYDDNSNVFLPE